MSNRGGNACLCCEAGISDEQKENSCILHLLRSYIYMLVSVACESRGEVCLVFHVSTDPYPVYVIFFLSIGTAFQMERRKIRSRKSLNCGI